MKRTAMIFLLAALSAALVFLMVKRAGQEPPLPAETPTAASESSPTVAPTAAPEPEKTPEPEPDIPAVDMSSWELRLVNAANPLPEDFAPQTQTVEGVYFDARAAQALTDFASAARAQGLNVVVTSGYRGYAEQSYTYNKKVSELTASMGDATAAAEKAKTIVAYPGTSEHQLGLCCDIVDGYYEYKTEALENSELAKWMKEHCAEYGFILRYPKDKTQETGIMFEPWHYRYVGTEAAAYIMENGLCLEEFAALYN